MLGSPIRKSWDHSSVDNSPRHIAASHVLHRLLVPRHPPCALKHLTTKMLASTVQFSNNGQNPTHPTNTKPPTLTCRSGILAMQDLQPTRKNKQPLVPSGPNRVSTIPAASTPLPEPPAHRQMTVLTTRTVARTELASTPPSSNQQKTSAPAWPWTTFRPPDAP